MDPREVTQKSISLVSRMSFPGFPVSGLCSGLGGLQCQPINKFRRIHMFIMFWIGVVHCIPCFPLHRVF